MRLRLLIGVIALFAVRSVMADTITIGATEGDVTLAQDSEAGVLISGEVKTISASYKFVKVNLAGEAFSNWTTFSKDKFQSFSYTDGTSFSVGDMSYEFLFSHGLIVTPEIVIFIWRGTENDLPEFISDIRSDLKIYADIKDKNQVTRYLNQAESLNDLVDDRIDWDRNKIITLQTTLAGLDGQIDALQTTIDALQGGVDTRNQQVSDRNDIIDIKDQEIDTLETEKAGLDPVTDAARIAAIDDEITQLKADVAVLVEANENDNIETQEAEDDIAVAEASRDEYENQKTTIPEEIAYLETEKDYLEANLENITVLIDEYDDIEKDLDTAVSGTKTVFVSSDDNNDDNLGALGVAALITAPIIGVSGGVVYETVKPDHRGARGSKDAVRYDNYYQGE